MSYYKKAKQNLHRTDRPTEIYVSTCFFTKHQITINAMTLPNGIFIYAKIYRLCAWAALFIFQPVDRRTKPPVTTTTQCGTRKRTASAEAVAENDGNGNEQKMMNAYGWRCDHIIPMKGVQFWECLNKMNYQYATHRPRVVGKVAAWIVCVCVCVLLSTSATVWEAIYRKFGYHTMIMIRMGWHSN